MSKDTGSGISRKRTQTSDSPSTSSNLLPTSLLTSFAKEYTRTKFIIFLEVTEASMQNECHLKRLQGLRKELDYLKSTDWQYDPPFGQS